MKLLRGIVLGLFFCAGSGMASAVWALGVRAEPVGSIESQMRLSQWMEASARSPEGREAELYWPGLVWRVPEEVPQQGRLKSLLLDAIRNREPAWGVSDEQVGRLADFVESLPVTGRVVVESADARWLEVNPVHDPVLHKGQNISIPVRPHSVTVVRGDGQLCRVAHSVQAFAGNYVRACDPAASPGVAWVVQPDGLVQRRKMANWNEEAQDPPAPGAWIVADDPAIPWPAAILEQLARLLATQGVAKDGDAAQMLPSPSPANTPFFGRSRKPGNLQMSASDWGSIGLLQTPTARMESAGNASITWSRTAPYTRMTGNLQPMDWLELSVRWVSISNRLYGPASFSGSQSYLDKNVDVKLRLSEEGPLMPQTAIGLRDLGGTGLFAGEYLVGSKRTGNADWSLGLGWGYMGARGNQRNPFSLLGLRSNTRTGSTVTTGQFNVSKFFTGPTSLFGGVQYQEPGEPWLLKLEYDGNDYQHEPQANNQKQVTPFNAGLVYRWMPGLDLSMNWERGVKLGLGVSFHGDLGKLKQPKLNDPLPEPVSPAYPVEEPDWGKVAALLEQKTSWHVQKIERAGSELLVRFEGADAMYWDGYMDRIASVLHRYTPGRNIMVFRIQPADRGLGIHEYLIDRQAWVEAQTAYAPAHRRQAAMFERPAQQGFVYPLADTLVDRPLKRFSGTAGINFDHTFGGPEGFMYKLSWGGAGNWYFRPDTWWTGSFDYRLLDNYNKFIFPNAKSTLPKVRTEIERYVGTSTLTMPVFQLTHVGRLNNENFYSVYGGMLESMYGGVGAEWLYRPWQSRVAFGVDVNAVRKRGFSQNFAFRDYRITTGHASLYWDTGVYGINAMVRAGKYLAGDLGATLELSRVFRNGVKMAAFATKTNVSAADFGEGSFDKGFYVDIPFDALLTRSSADMARISWHPLTRDGGAILKRKFQLYELTGKQEGRLLERAPYDEKRVTQFGDVPDDFAEIEPPDSVFRRARRDLSAMGHAMGGRDFWESMAWMGGISLLSSVADKPADKLAVRYGNRRLARGMENAGNFLPIAAAGVSGLMFLTSERDSLMERASYSSLAAGGMGLVGATALKYVVGRERPIAGKGSARFTPMSRNNSNTSWPSIHTTIAWATITPYAKAYDAPWLYGVAAVTNAARIGGRNHWLSDTVGGALLGYAVGDFVWAGNKRSKRGMNLAVSPNGVTAYWKVE